MLTLHSDRLRVEITMPGEKPNVGYRFDRSGFISDVILDGSMHFCAAEPKNLSHPTSLGRGLCDEIRFDTAPETEDGGLFPKFGIGLFKKPVGDTRYIFHKQYEIAEEFPVLVETEGNNKVTFVTEPIECNGYALRVTKVITVEGTRLTMALKLENVGQKTMAMNEFCHNFVSIDGMALGSDYTLELPQLKEEVSSERLMNRNGKSSSFRGKGKGLTLCEFTAIDTDISFRDHQIEDTLPFTWKMSHAGARAYVQAEESVKPGWFAVWAVDHMIAPEIVHEFTIAPGETEEWSRSWTFEQY